MPSSLKLLAASCLLSCFASVTYAQGCSSIEPNDPNCLLPLWVDSSMNLTFDDQSPSAKFDSYKSLTFANFTVASPEASSSQYVRTFANSTSYARLHANEQGLIAGGETAFFKIETFYFGCSEKSSSPSSEKPQNCTLTVDAMCAGPDADGIEFPDLFTFEYEYVAPADSKFAELKYVNMATYGKRWACYNYTLSAEAAGGKPAVLFLDEVGVVEYFDNPAYY